MSFILGLTGSIGMGKSTTAQMFRDLGVPVWDADAAVEQLYKTGGDAVAALRSLNPDFTNEGGVDRNAIKAEIQKNPALLSEIEAIVHPLVKADREQFLKNSSDAPLVVLDIPLLYENESQNFMNAVLVVSAPAEIQRERVLSRGSMTEEVFKMILAKQVPDAEKRNMADYVIETLSLESTRAAVAELVETLRSKHA